MMKQAKEEGEAGAVSQWLDSCLVSIRPWGQPPEGETWQSVKDLGTLTKTHSQRTVYES